MRNLTGSKPNSLINVRISEELRNEFKEKTEKENTTMSKVVIKCIKRYVKSRS